MHFLRCEAMNFERSGIHHKPKKLQGYVKFAELHITTRSGLTKRIKCFLKPGQFFLKIEQQSKYGIHCIKIS